METIVFNQIISLPTYFVCPLEGKAGRALHSVIRELRLRDMTLMRITQRVNGVADFISGSKACTLSPALKPLLLRDSTLHGCHLYRRHPL